MPFLPYYAITKGAFSTWGSQRGSCGNKRVLLRTPVTFISGKLYYLFLLWHETLEAGWEQIWIFSDGTYATIQLIQLIHPKSSCLKSKWPFWSLLYVEGVSWATTCGYKHDICASFNGYIWIFRFTTIYKILSMIKTKNKLLGKFSMSGSKSCIGTFCFVFGACKTSM